MKPPEITLNDIEEILSLTIKGDNANKLALFLAMLSAFTDDSQINVALNAPSSTGKHIWRLRLLSCFRAIQSYSLVMLRRRHCSTASRHLMRNAMRKLLILNARS